MVRGPLEAATLEPPAIVYEHQDEEAMLIERAKDAVTTSMWTVGECAAIWAEKYGKGRPESEFAERIGLDVATVRQCKKVSKRFGGIKDEFKQLTFAHFVEAEGIENAEAWLTQADRVRMGIEEFRETINAEHYCADDGEEGESPADSGDDREPAETLPEDEEDLPSLATLSDDDEGDTNQANADFMRAVETLERVFDVQRGKGWIDVDREYAVRKMRELLAKAES